MCACLDIPLEEMVGSNEVVVCGSDFHVSYNSRDVQLYGTDVTILATNSLEQFYVLNGNHVPFYEAKSMHGFDACMEYFKQQISAKNHLSD